VVQGKGREVVMEKDLFNITFKGVDELIKVAERKAQLLDANVRNAVARTVLWGAGRIAEECPTDTGRLRASILGYLVHKYGLRVEGDPVAVADGISQSVTQINGYEGRIGTNVAYASHQEYGFNATGPKKLTDKQRRYLFAVGILQSKDGRVVPGTVTVLVRKSGKITGGKTYIGGINKVINRRAGSVSHVKGKGFFRRNLVLIDQYFQEQMEEAIKATEEDRLIPVTF